jgi:hypothetical protein
MPEKEEQSNDVEVLRSCRDHWKKSFEDIKLILQGDEKCNACKGRGYTVFYEHQEYPVPHDNEHHFLCTCVSSKVLKYLGA